MKVNLEYGVIFGKGDSVGGIPWEVDLTDEEYAVYLKCINDEEMALCYMNAWELDDFPELQAVLERAHCEIEENEWKMYQEEHPDETENPFETGWEIRVSFAEPDEA